MRSSNLRARVRLCQTIIQPRYITYAPRERLDPSTLSLLDDVNLGVKSKLKKVRDGSASSEILPSGFPISSLEISQEAEVLAQQDVQTGRALNSQQDENVVDWEDRQRRDERRSPAAVFGIKRMGVVVLPDKMVEAIDEEISNTPDLKALRTAYLTYNYPSSPSIPHPEYDYDKPIRMSRSNAVTPMISLAQAAATLPGEYSVMKNVLEEVKSRLGDEEWDEVSNGSWVVTDGGMGSGVWAGAQVLGLLKDGGEELRHVEEQVEDVKKQVKVEHVQASRHMMVLSETLLDGAAKPGFNIQHSRHQSTSIPPRIAMSTFHLSKLPTKTSRANRIQEIWNTGAELMIIVDKGNIEGFKAVSEARAQLLELGRNTHSSPEDQPVEESLTKRQRKRLAKKAKKNQEDDGVMIIDGEKYFAEGFEGGQQEEEVVKKDVIGSHVIAPCPHDGICPLLATRDLCHFSQRLQTPRFLRKTKHHKRGDEDTKYSYVVIRRGARPESTISSAGRMGAVGREVIEKAKDKDKRGVLTAIQGQGEEELFEVLRDESLLEVEEGVDIPVDAVEMRKEAYSWPRLVYPPIKRPGHIIMDACHESGNIVRLTIPRSLSKQAYHDARKSAWGDLFPHEPKGELVVRTRGVKKLNKYEATEEELLGLEDEAEPEIEVSEDWPVAELEDVVEEERTEKAEGEDVVFKRFG